jgi:general secretion pathway protein I
MNRDQQIHTAPPGSHLSGPLPARWRGFTFLEIMVALAILSIVLTAVYRMQSQTISMNTEKQFLTLAPLLGAGKLAQLESTAMKDGADEAGDFGEDYPGYRWHLSVEPATSELFSDTASGLLHIDMAVSYQENTYTFHLRTYRFVQK